MFSIRDEIDYTKQVALSKLLINYCLSNGKGVIFNFLGYSENLLSELQPNFYFSVSDDFIQLNSEYMTTADINNIEKAVGREEFKKKFIFLDDIFDILVNFGLINFSLIVACDGSDDDVNSFDIVSTNTTPRLITDILYAHVINNSSSYCYDFSNIIINY